MNSGAHPDPQNLNLQGRGRGVNAGSPGAPPAREIQEPPRYGMIIAHPGPSLEKTLVPGLQLEGSRIGTSGHICSERPSKERSSWIGPGAPLLFPKEATLLYSQQPLSLEPPPPHPAVHLGLLPFFSQLYHNDRQMHK